MLNCLLAAAAAAAAALVLLLPLPLPLAGSLHRTQKFTDFQCFVFCFDLDNSGQVKTKHKTPKNL